MASEKRIYTRKDLQARYDEQETSRSKQITTQLVDDIYKMVLATAAQGQTSYYRQILLTTLPYELRHRSIKMAVEELSKLFEDVSFKVETAVQPETGADYIVGVRVDWA
jgi:hypothetical protein